MSELTILHRDQRLVVIHKPAGLLVHRTGLDAGETRFAVQLLRDQLGCHVWPLHRLDKGTSGALAFALSPDVARKLAPAFAQGLVGKHYLAVVRGWPAACGEINHPLTRHATCSGAAATQRLAQAAQTHFRRLARLNLPIAIAPYPESRYAVLALQPLTGRQHQLRRHLKHISHPIIGDARYGKGQHNRAFAEYVGAARLWLACTRLVLPGAAAEQHSLAIHCPLAPEFAQLLHGQPWCWDEDWPKDCWHAIGT